MGAVYEKIKVICTWTYKTGHINIVTLEQA